MNVKFETPEKKQPPERIDPLRRVWIPIEKKRSDGVAVFQTHDRMRYERDITGAIRRAIPKVKGKAARRADKRGRRKMAEEKMIDTTKGPMKESELRKQENADGSVEYYLGEELVHRSAAVLLTGQRSTGSAKLG